jgi:hypothetical protein
MGWILDTPRKIRSFPAPQLLCGPRQTCLHVYRTLAAAQEWSPGVMKCVWRSEMLTDSMMSSSATSPVLESIVFLPLVAMCFHGGRLHARRDCADHMHFTRGGAKRAQMLDIGLYRLRAMILYIGALVRHYNGLNNIIAASDVLT